MNRRFVIAGALAALCTPLTAEAQPPRKLPLIGVVIGGIPPLGFWYSPAAIVLPSAWEIGRTMWRTTM